MKTRTLKNKRYFEFILLKRLNSKHLILREYKDVLNLFY